MTRLRDQRGFTLVENLIALAILGLVLGTFAQVTSTHSGSADRIDATDHALTFARSLMDRLGRDIPLSAGNTGGAIDDGGSWSLKVQPYALSTTLAGLPQAYLVQLDVRERSAPVISLTTIRFAGR